MARKDAMLRLHSRLVARRDALRKALDGDLDAYREYAAMNVVGDSVDAAVDTANDEISSQIVEIESRELGQIEHALQRIVEGVYGRCEFCSARSPRPGSTPCRTRTPASSASARTNGTGRRSAGGSRTSAGPRSTTSRSPTSTATPTSS